MRFLIHAYLPPSLCGVLIRHGHELIHTSQLPDLNRTEDGRINQISIDDQRVVVSKDSDFFYSHILQGRPWKMLLVRTGNISARDLILAALNQCTLVEMAG